MRPKLAFMPWFVNWNHLCTWKVRDTYGSTNIVLDDAEIVESLQRFVSIIQYSTTGKEFDNVAKVPALLSLAESWVKQA